MLLGGGPAGFLGGRRLPRKLALHCVGKVAYRGRANKRQARLLDFNSGDWRTLVGVAAFIALVVLLL
jgi:hypothetical protein